MSSTSQICACFNGQEYFTCVTLDIVKTVYLKDVVKTSDKHV